MMRRIIDHDSGQDPDSPAGQLRGGAVSELTSSIHAAALVAVFPLASGAQTREAEIEKARDRKQREATPEVSTAGENFFQKIKDGRVRERILSGMRGLKVGLGGLMNGSGFAVGPEFETANPAQTIIVRAGWNSRIWL